MNKYALEAEIISRLTPLLNDNIVIKPLSGLSNIHDSSINNVEIYIIPNGTNPTDKLVGKNVTLTDVWLLLIVAQDNGIVDLSSIGTVLTSIIELLHGWEPNVSNTSGRFRVAGAMSFDSAPPVYLKVGCSFHPLVFTIPTMVS